MGKTVNRDSERRKIGEKEKKTPERQRPLKSEDCGSPPPTLNHLPPGSCENGVDLKVSEQPLF